MGFRDPVRVLEASNGIGGALFESFRFREGVIQAVSAPSGNAMTLDPGSGAPSLTLSLEDAPAGGKRSVARIGAPFLPLAVARPVVGPGPNQGGGVLGPGWVNYGSGYGALKFFLLASGVVHMQGLLLNVLGATLGAGSNPPVVVGGTLPTWAWPANSVITMQRASVVSPGVGHARIDVNADGSVFMVESSVANGQWLSLAGSYHTDN